MRLLARIWRTSPLKNWKHDLLCLYQHPTQLRLVICNVGLFFQLWLMANHRVDHNEAQFENTILKLRKSRQ
jgi:hypothetical protein